MAMTNEERLAKQRERDRRYRAENSEMVRKKRREHMRRLRAANPEKAREYSRCYWAAHKEKHRESTRRHQKTHPQKYVVYTRRRQARLAGAPINDMTAEQWDAIKAHYGYRCVYCGKKQQRLTQDHIDPISKRGSNTYRNIVPACQRCNSKKGTGPVLKPVQPLLLVGNH